MEGVELKARRERLGLSVGQLAREFGVIPSSVYRWEKGEVSLHGLTAVGADTVLRNLERRARRAAPGHEQEEGETPPSECAACDVGWTGSTEHACSLSADATRPPRLGRAGDA